MNRKLHIISFDVPFPADYGGVIDVFYKLKELHSQGISITLHAFHYGRDRAAALEKYCTEVIYYKRRTFKNPFYGSVPYIVSSRNSAELLTNLMKDDAPILFEGLHSTFFLAHLGLKDRFKIVRTHNIEHDYYRHLEKSETNFFKKYFFRIEAEKLKRYQNVLKHANLIAAISQNDSKYLGKKFNNVIYLPAFHANQNVTFNPEAEDFILYHGNLAVSENYTAATYLIAKVFSKLSIKCIIAGNNPPEDLVNLINQHSNCELHTNTTSEKLHDLMQQAKINVLYTHQATGIKLKLLNALFVGKHCVVNELMVKGTGLENLCQVYNKPAALVTGIETLLQTPYTLSMHNERKNLLLDKFSNHAAAKNLIANIEWRTSSVKKMPPIQVQTQKAKPLSFLLNLLSL